MRARRSYRWSTKFGCFVARLSVRGVADAMASRGVIVTDRAVYGWLSGRTFPRREHVEALVAVSSGRLDLEDVFRHQREVRGGGNGGDPEIRKRLDRG